MCYKYLKLLLCLRVALEQAADAFLKETRPICATETPYSVCMVMLQLIKLVMFPHPLLQSFLFIIGYFRYSMERYSVFTTSLEIEETQCIVHVFQLCHEIRAFWSS